MEMEKSVAKKRLILFIVLTILMGWIVFSLIPILGQTYGNRLSMIIVMAAMFTPTLANLLTRLITKEGFQNMYLHPHFKGHMKYYLLIYLGPMVFLFLSGAVYFLIFPASFDPNLTVLKGLVAFSGKPGLTAANLLISQLLVFVTLGPVINILPTMGEELGWRGYLLPKLRMFLSDRAALVVSGVIWGLWHTPVILMGHNYGTHYVGYPWLGILAMIVFCVWLGVIEGYLSIKLASAIPAGMIHSAINAGGGFAIYLVKSGYNPLLGPAAVGLLGGLPFIILAIILLIKVGNKTPK